MTNFDQFSYGSYTHPIAEIQIEGIKRNVVYSETHRRNIFREVWDLKGKIVKQGDTSQADVFAALTIVRNIYATDGQSAGFAGTPLWMDNSDAIGGTVVTNRISHSEIKGAQGVTFLHYTFSLMKESFLSNIQDLLSYSERVTFSDNQGRPLQVWRQPVSGLAVVQFVSTSSWFEATQSGSATSRDPSIQPESMLWPESLLGEVGSRQATNVTPKMIRGVPVEYTASWNYRYRQAVPFSGGPHIRG